MSTPQNFALVVEMTLLRKPLTVDISDVVVLTYFRYLIKLPPTVSHVQWISAFAGVFHTQFSHKLKIFLWGIHPLR